MKELLSKLCALDPYKSLAEWKERTGRKVIGCFPMHIPHEFIHAAGALPVVMWESNEPITLGHAHVQPNNCGLVRSVVDDAVKGKLGFLDGMVFYDTCNQARGLPFIIGRNARPAYLETTYLPVILTSPAAKAYLIENLEELKVSVGNFTGQRVTADSLNQSILLYNKNRSLLRELYGLRRKNPRLLKAREVVAIVRCSMLMPVEEHNKLMERLLGEMETKSVPADEMTRVILTGNLCQAPPADVLNLIEEVGAVVADDDLYTGSRYFANDVEVGENPIEALADRYLRRIPPCPTKVDWETDWSDYIIEMAKGVGAKGVITFLVKYCPPHMCYYPDVKRKLAAAQVPEVLIETEHEIISLEQARTRLQAFMETLRRV